MIAVSRVKNPLSSWTSRGAAQLRDPSWSWTEFYDGSRDDLRSPRMTARFTMFDLAQSPRSIAALVRSAFDPA
jgi:hypothetical protein